MGEWLGEIVVHPCGQTPVAIALHGVGGQGDDRDACRLLLPFPFADGGCGGEAIHDGHLAVHEHDAIGMCGGEGAGLPAIFRAVYVVTEQFEQPHRDLAVDRIVFDQEHRGPVRVGYDWCWPLREWCGYCRGPLSKSD